MSPKMRGTRQVVGFGTGRDGIWIYVAQALLPVPRMNLKDAGTDKSVCAT